METPAEILGLDRVVLIEPSYADLVDDQFTLLLGELTGDQARLLVDEEGDPVCMAVHMEDGAWAAGCFHLRPMTGALVARFEALGGDIFQEERAIWEQAVRGYYSREIESSITPALDDLNPARTGAIRSLVARFLGDGDGKSCLDCGCGSGVGSSVLREMGYRPLSCDNDASLLSLGFARGRLVPEETMLIDATILHRYAKHCDAGLGLMVGEIHGFNEGMWEQITRELVTLADRCLITTGTEREAVLVRQWAGSCRVQAEIFENPGDPLYDRWVCLTTR